MIEWLQQGGVWLVIMLAVALFFYLIGRRDGRAAEKEGVYDSAINAKRFDNLNHDDLVRLHDPAE